MIVVQITSLTQLCAPDDGLLPASSTSMTRRW